MEDEKGFCKVSDLEEIKKHDFILTPGRYVGFKPEEDDGIPFEEKMKTLTSELDELFKEFSSANFYYLTTNQKHKIGFICAFDWDKNPVYGNFMYLCGLQRDLSTALEMTVEMLEMTD